MPERRGRERGETATRSGPCAAAPGRAGGDAELGALSSWRPIAELEELALNPALAPTRVFPGDANDQAAYLLWDRRSTTTRSTSESRPAAANQFPVPAQDGGRCEQQAADGESAAESCQTQAVGWEQVWLLDVAAQDGDLMPEG